MLFNLKYQRDIFSAKYYDNTGKRSQDKYKEIIKHLNPPPFGCLK